jgi:hypothetical protein
VNRIKSIFLIGENVFSHNTIVEAFSLLEEYNHSEIERFTLRFDLDHVAPASLGSKANRVNAIIRYLIANPTILGPSHSNLILEAMEHLLSVRLTNPYLTEPLSIQLPKLAHSLGLDGYQIDPSAKILSILPSITPLAPRQTEVEQMLLKQRFTVANGHLQQAISAHTRGDWAAANAQIRSFIESLFSEFARVLITTGLGTTSYQRLEQLAQLNPPFIDQNLNEWDFSKPKGFVQGFWNRLHPMGSHPGLSDEDDCTFRLQLSFLVAHRFLKRFENYP